jgi:dTDP-4-amino-4,6-dideoxygalactose transaminase
MNWRIPLSDIDFDSDENAAVAEVIDSKWLTMGNVTQEFEQAFADYIGAKYAIAVANGTAALHLACIALNLKPGDEVIVPSLTFVATANAIRYTGATPIFADITGENDLNVSYQSIRSLITKRTRAIIVVHYGGYACHMSNIMALAHEYNLKVIEDAAHAVGSELGGRKLGTWGELGCFSFFSNKNMTTGEGGMIVTNDEALSQKLHLLRSHGMTTMTWDRHKGHAWSYDVVDLGYNYRIDEIRAALGVVQLRKLEKNNTHRRQLTQLYHDMLLEMVPQIILPFSTHSGKSAAHLMPVLLPHSVNRSNFMEQLKSHGIQTSIHYPPIHLFSAYQDFRKRDGSLSKTEDIAAREVTLPLYPTMADDDVNIITRAMREALKKSN